MFLAYVSPRRALVDKRLYLPKSWTSNQVKNYRSKTEPWRCWSGSWSWATSNVADLPGGTGGPGDALRAGTLSWTSPEYPGFGKADMEQRWAW